MKIHIQSLSIAALILLSVALPQNSPAQASPPDAPTGGRERLLMDFDWRFALGNANDPARDFDPGSSFFSYLAKAGNGAGAAAADFDDHTWRVVNLPHDWAVELPFSDRGSGSHGYKAVGLNFPENSVGWYRKRFSFPHPIPANASRSNLKARIVTRRSGSMAFTWDAPPAVTPVSVMTSRTI